MMIERLLRLISDVVPTERDCWEWPRARMPKGYGVVHLAGECHRQRLAHRTVYELLVGPIPDGMQVCHHCDNPPCVNPAHLFVGTNTDNVRDMIAKGRRYVPPTIGESNGHAKLSESDVRTIRRLYCECVSVSALAVEYEMTVTNIRFIVKRKTWSHVA